MRPVARQHSTECRTTGSFDRLPGQLCRLLDRLSERMPPRWRRLQTLLEAEGLKHVDYLTVSVEGHELQVRRRA